MISAKEMVGFGTATFAQGHAFLGFVSEFSISKKSGKRFKRFFETVNEFFHYSAKNNRYGGLQTREKYLTNFSTQFMHCSRLWNSF